jgi:hypothetical protein
MSGRWKPRRPALAVALPVGLLTAAAALTFGAAAGGAAPAPVADRFRPPGFGTPAAVQPTGTGDRGVAPLVHGFAQQPGKPRLRPLPSPVRPLPVNPRLDGCDHNYAGAACVPVTFPRGVTDRCGWLRQHGIGPLTVRGVDRQRLDPSRDGVACGVGDR